MEETYALIEAGYGIMNEHQVAIGESTCASKLYAFPSTHGGKARIEVSQMSEIALERTKTAADAVKLMGKLAEELGFYAADWTGGDASKGEGGEALTVIDPNEAWVFHVCADDTGTSAVWVAQRVPEGHVSISLPSFLLSSPIDSLFLSYFPCGLGHLPPLPRSCLPYSAYLCVYIYNGGGGDERMVIVRSEMHHLS